MVTTALYVVDLEHTPVYFGGDEAHFAVHGYALARSARDLDGTALPLFINFRDPRGDRLVQDQFHAWYQPLLFYVVAGTLEILPLNEASVRLPTALIGGLIAPLLMFLVAMRILRDRRLALLALLVLALSPSLLVLSRQALDYVCPIPFVLGWLWCLAVVVERGGLGHAFLGGLLLGVGFYSYIASWIFMPICLAMSVVAYYRSRPQARLLSIVTTIGFLIPLGLLIPWAWFHPEMLRETFRRYVNLARDVDGITMAQRARQWVSPGDLRQILAAYAGYFDPIFLFVRGGVSMTASTARSGVLLVPVAVFLGVGLYEAARRARRDAIALVIVGGLLLAPIPASLVHEGRMIQREMFMLPFAAMLAAYGGAVLLRQSSVMIRGAAAILLIAMPVQFAYFSVDYFTRYQHRSAFYYDSVVFADVADTLVAADPPVILLSHELNDSTPKWRFYSTKRGREDLLARTRYVDHASAEVAAAPVGSLLVVYQDATTLARLEQAGQWSVVRTVVDIDRRPASVILRKAR